jgi:probable rRNA maturation factor
MKIDVEIAIEYSKWDDFPEFSPEYFAKTASSVLSRYQNLTKIPEFELSVLLTEDKKMAELNNQFRNKNKATNVLSFPDIEINWRRILEFKTNSEYIYLGDIAFGYETIEKEAEEKSISFQDHFRHLLVHSILHLIGYDHIDDEDAEAMENIEVEILDGFGINSPYE